MNITIKYFCPICKTWNELEIPERNDGQDIVDFIENHVMPRVALAHLSKKPGCHKGRIDLMIPDSPKGFGFAKPVEDKNFHNN